jgi:hypothetical protein
MKRKLLFVLGLTLIFSLVAVSSLPAEAGTPDKWTRVPFSTDDSPNTGVTSMVVFKGNLYAASQDFVNGMRIWRMGKRGAWTQVSEAGFGDPMLSTPEDMIVFKGMLYATAGDWWQRTVSQLWRTPDGYHWEAVTTDGFGESDIYLFHRYVIYKDMLYVGAGRRWVDENTPVGLQIWRSATGAPGTWVKVVDDGMGDSMALDISSFCEFKGALYAAVQTDWIHPSRIWRTYDGVNWEVLKNDGFGYPDPLPEESLFYDTPGVMTVFKDYMYLGMAVIDLMTVDWEHPEANSSPAKIWRTKDGVNWEPVVLDGFGDWRNRKIDSLIVHRGQLYAATWTDNWVWGLNDGGIQVWRSPDGMHWTQINEGGFGDPDNWSVHLGANVLPYKNSLYFGSVNPNGGQIWKLTQK